MKRHRILTLATGLLLVLAACGGDGSDGDAASDERPPEEVLAAAGTATEESGTARIASDQVTSAQSQEFTTTVEGIVDLESGDSESTLELVLPGQEPQSAELITDGATGYIEASAFPGAPTDSRWISIDFESVGAQMGINVEAFRQNGAGQLAYLSEVAEVEEVGTETIRDVETTHYRFTADIAALAESGPEELRSSYEQLVEITGAEEVPTEVWIDGDDRVRRIVTEVEIEQQGQQFTQQSTVEYYEFGVELDVQPPPEEDTVDITELGGGGQAP
ncbi:MAG: hypothetical protein GEU68_01125 [Actinobacteria bacterium]|nr:hypothetical protein [Actinomycetota bacterium]